MRNGATLERSNGVALLGNGQTNGQTNGHANGHTNGHTNGHANGQTNGHANGHTNGHRKNIQSNGHNGTSTSVNPPKTQFLLPFSAHDDKTLKANYDILSKHTNDWALADIAYTLSARRSLLQNRSFVVVGSDDVASGLPSERAMTAKVPASGAPTLGFIFTGQGAQWPRMGASLMAEYPSCLATVQRLDKYLDNIEPHRRPWSIEEVLRQEPEKSPVHDAELSQPLVTALQIMLVNLLSQWNILPRAVVGHSSGEIAAGYAAGLLTEKQAIVAAYLRGKAIAENRTTGLMMAVTGEESQIQGFVDRFDGRITIACHNSPESYTLSGDSDAVLELKSVLDAQNIFCRTLKTSNNAYHSDHMWALGPKYEQDLEAHMSKNTAVNALKEASKSRKQAVFFSSVYGHAIPWMVLGPKYWRQNLESPVLFHQATSEMVTQASVDILVEIGPHSALQGPLRQLSKAMDPSVKFPAYCSAIARGSDNVKDVLTMAGNLFTKGYEVDLARVNAAEQRGGNQYQLGKVITDLPRYQWQYSGDIVLFENRYTREWRLRTHPRHDILGSRIPGTNQAEPLWRNKLIVKNVPWLADHRVSTSLLGSMVSLY